MRVIIQRVQEASVKVEEEVISSIGQGLMILLGVEDADTKSDIIWLANKIVQLRVFDDENGTMNNSLLQVKGELLVVSQFTLFASTKKGNRPSWHRAAKGEFSQPMYDHFCQVLSAVSNQEVKKGVFGADMKVAIINDGPVTIVIDTKNKE